ncbi:hypothetical protein HF577_16345 [Pseudonocardia xinjiangensis]|uniref:ATP-dependent DNA ligase family profile domain-containing protein n=1 Tax=Pseudonocardia xinjiangensis TaxID=75289 RepID=A0ABX1RG88_9PSEU|nr:hypothetical protein [Pseudonocardia xinjiangensis]
MDRVALQSRQQRPLGRYFPEIVCAVSELDVDVVLDGELVLWHEGRMDFAALQGRLHPADSRARELSLAMPASYVVFDVLALDGKAIVTGPTACAGHCSRSSSPAGSRMAWSSCRCRPSQPSRGRGCSTTPTPASRASWRNGSTTSTGRAAGCGGRSVPVSPRKPLSAVCWARWYSLRRSSSVGLIIVAGCGLPAGPARCPALPATTSPRF